jgi:hypothetical protein
VPRDRAATPPPADIYAWLSAFEEELQRLRPHVSSRLAQTVGRAEYSADADPKEGCTELHGNIRRAEGDLVERAAAIARVFVANRVSDGMIPNGDQRAADFLVANCIGIHIPSHQMSTRKPPTGRTHASRQRKGTTPADENLPPAAEDPSVAALAGAVAGIAAVAPAGSQVEVEIAGISATPVVVVRKPSQSPGTQSTVYVPVILKIFRDRFRPGASNVVFSLDDVRNAVDAVRAVSANPNSISSRNPADVIYRMRSRTKLPDEILALGFHVLRPIGRGQYQFERATTTIIEPPETVPTPTFRALALQALALCQVGLIFCNIASGAFSLLRRMVWMAAATVTGHGPPFALIGTTEFELDVQTQYERSAAAMSTWALIAEVGSARGTSVDNAGPIQSNASATVGVMKRVNDAYTCRSPDVLCCDT